MSSSEGMDHLSSIHNNPFVRKFGQSDAAMRQETNDTSSRNVKSNSENVPEVEGEQEYHVNSGFVNKLRSKFAQLENKSNAISLSRRSASVENLLHVSSSNDNSYQFRSRYGKSGRSSTDDTILPTSSTTKVELRKPLAKPSNRPSSHEIISSRPRSSEIVSRSSDKPPVPKPKKIEYDYSRPGNARSVKPPIPKKTAADSLSKKRNSGSDISSPKSKIEHHDWTVAPDLEKIGRDNMIIIESSAPSPKEKTEQKKKSELTDGADEYRRVKSVKDKDKSGDENELPKPNTVSAFRSLFENAKKTNDVLHVRRQGHSPTRKSSSSDTNSPRVTSPVSTPRSPLIRMNDDNVYENASKYSSEQEIQTSSPRSSVNADNLSNKLPNTSSSDVTENVDTSSVSIQKSLEMFRNRKASVDKEFVVDDSASPVGWRGSSSEKEIISSRPLSPSVQNSLTPVHSMSKVFDSKSVKADKQKRSKAVVVKRQSIPKDTLELKHEADIAKSRTPTPTEENKTIVENSFAKSDDNRTIIQIGKEMPEETVSNEANIKPSRKSGKNSPRKTNIFDSSNMVKRNRDPPTVPLSPCENNEAKSPFNNMPKEVSIEIKNKDTETAMEISPVKPTRKAAPGIPPSGITAVQTSIVVNNNTTKPNNQTKPPIFKVKNSDFPKTVDTKNERVKPSPKTIDNVENLVSGRSSFLTNRLQKPNQDTQQLKTTSVHLANGSSPSPVPRKRQAPERPIVNGTSADIDMVEEKKEKTPPPLPSTEAPALPSTNIDDIMKRKKKSSQSSTKMIFDSSKIVSKRKEPPKRKPPRKTIEQLNTDIRTNNSVTVPMLDLTSITNDTPGPTEYQEGYIPTDIKPCPFKFVGAEVKFQKSPFKKTRKRKANAKIVFDDHATTTFEYEAEDIALETYLAEHPEERDEILKQESEEHEFIHGVTENLEDLVHDTPHAPEHDTAIKTNTVIGISAGALTNYKSKMQVPEFVFGMTPEPAEEYSREPELEQPDPDSMNLLPADDNDLDAFSAETGKADMLF